LGCENIVWAGHPSPDTHFEVDRVHTEFLGSLAEVVYVLDGSAQGSHHLLAMATDLVRARGQVEVGEVGLGWGVGVEHPGRVGQSVVLTAAGPTVPAPPCGSHPLVPCPMGSPSLYLVRASAPISSSAPPSLPHICWISFLSSAVSMVAAAGVARDWWQQHCRDAFYSC
uniref:Uncharacterized protein n=1 Tax=Zonotrichia albicollis TaxID=44394 RepID=A0A8D2NFA7_ZONAL